MHPKARIYRPTKTAMQSGTGNTQHWVLEFQPEDARFIEHIMGWTGSSDMRQELQLCFSTKEEAIRHARTNNIPYEIYEPKRSRFKAKSYADNFAYNRIDTYQLVHEEKKNQ